MKNILNVLVDILTLTAICIAAIGHVLPWFDRARLGVPGFNVNVPDYQTYYASRSGIALGVLGGLICFSLVFNWGPTMRRLLNVLMFGSSFAALLFELMIFSNYVGWGGGQRVIQLRETDTGYALAMIPTCCAVGLCLLRMLWTMPPTRRVVAAPLDQGPAVQAPIEPTGSM